MNDRDAMQLTLCVLLLISGLTRLLRRTLCRAENRAALPAAAVVAGSGLLAGAFCLIIVRFTGPAMLLPALLLLTVVCTSAAAAQGVTRCRTRRQVISALLLVLWCAGVLAMTLLLREPGDNSVLTRFDFLQDVARRQSLDPLTDVLLNIALFLPLGLLLPSADAEPRLVWLNVLSAALALTAVIESGQLLFQLGQADVEDLAANVLGALSGLFLRQMIPGRSEQF